MRQYQNQQRTEDEPLKFCIETSSSQILKIKKQTKSFHAGGLVSTANKIIKPGLFL